MKLSKQQLIISSIVVVLIIIAIIIYASSRSNQDDSTKEEDDQSIQQVELPTQIEETPVETKQVPSYLNTNLSAEERAQLLLDEMTLEEKIGQMVQAEVATTSLDDMNQYYIGSLLSAGGSGPSSNTPEAWMNLYDRYQKQALLTRLQIPILYGIDAVHGHNNVFGATIFPHNIGLGATHDPELLQSIGEVVANEVRSTGINWTFAPTLAVPRNERWGRTYEGFSENPELVGQLGTAMLLGLQGSREGSDFLDQRHILSSVKHWVGDGATTDGIDRGNAEMTEDELDELIQPYREVIQAGARSVMVSYSSWNGEKLHGNSYLIQDKLKGELGFTGFVISDLNGIHEINNDFTIAVKTSVNAGIDMFMISDNWLGFIQILTELVDNNEVTIDRINDAVKRILIVKFESGVFEHPYGDQNLLESNSLGSDEHRQVAREAVRKSLVLLKNDNQLLPISKDVKRVFVAGAKANDIGLQSGGWTISWQGSAGNITTGTTILDGIKQTVSGMTEVIYDKDGIGAEGHDVAIVVVGEEPYAENAGDRENLVLSNSDLRVLAAVRKSGIPMVVILTSGRPLIISDELKDWDAFVAAWLPGTEGNGIADVLFGDYQFSGKLPVSWPRSMKQIPIQYDDAEYDPLFPYGFGLSYE
jgi:beta-glucosidase